MEREGSLEIETVIEVQHFMYLNIASAVNINLKHVIEVQHFMYLNSVISISNTESEH